MNPLIRRPVLVTGGSGFAGSYIARTLADGGARVVTYDIADPRTESAHVIGSADVNLEKGSIDDWPRVFEVVAATVLARSSTPAASWTSHTSTSIR